MPPSPEQQIAEAGYLQKPQKSALTSRQSSFSGEAGAEVEHECNQVINSPGANEQMERAGCSEPLCPGLAAPGYTVPGQLLQVGMPQVICHRAALALGAAVFWRGLMDGWILSLG